MKSRRFLVGKMERQNDRQRVSSDEIATAIRKFQEQGGLIQQLPPQREDARTMVGNRFDSPYESVFDS